MGIDIYYFSGTGNSLAVARDIAEKNQGVLISIPSVINREIIETNADTVGIVFPVHYIWNGGVPIIIERFIKKLKNIHAKYIFAVCTCGGGQGDTIIKLSDMIKKSGGILASGFAVKMPYNYTTWSGSLDNTTAGKKQKMFDACKLKLEAINEHVKTKRAGKLERDSEQILFFADLFNLRVKLGKPHYQTKAGFLKPTALPFSEILPLMDKSFYYDAKCNGCGICSKVCPVNSIKMADNKPLWQHRCEQCFACLQWCPKEAIQFGERTQDGKRYHHPEVKLTDMFNKMG